MKTSLSLTFFFLFGLFVHAQTFPLLDVPVEINGQTLSDPWAGGLNSPQFSAVDLNNDDILDLYAFDRAGNIHITYLNMGSSNQPEYVFAPIYARQFPQVYNFSLLRDYNQDGIMDIFAHAGVENIPGYKVYKGKFENDKLRFDRVEFPDFEFDVLNYVDEATGDDFFIYTNKVDFPSVEDIDGDGDIDIVANQGDSYLTYFRNLAIEEGFTVDTLIFTLEDDCWGKFYIDGTGAEFTLSTDENICATNFVSNTADLRHGGSTVTTLDLDNDGDREVLYGDATNPRIICAKNGGTPTTAWMTSQDVQFPENTTEIYIPDFATTFYLDADGDGIKDILASPNLPFDGPDYESVWLYKNVNNNENPIFEFQQKDFLVNEMIDLGTGAHPVFVDYNADGLMDLVVGNDNLWQSDLSFLPSLTLFENVGTSTAPQFQMVDNDWLNFSQFSTTSFAFTPTFGDLDSDGDLDLLVGDRFGILFYAENIAGSGNTFSFGAIQSNWLGIDVGQYAAPFIMDIDNDNKPDLIIGERNGNINFLPNLGTPTQPDFHPNVDEAPNNNFFGQIAITNPGQIVGTSTPVIVEFSGTSYIVSGAHDGKIRLFSTNSSNLSTGTFTKETSQWGEILHGRTSHPSLTDIDDDGYLDIVVGTFRGGLSLYTTTLSIDGILPIENVENTFELIVFPNPANELLNIELNALQVGEKEYRIYNTVGQLISTGEFENNKKQIYIDKLNRGIYFLEIEFDGYLLTKRFAKQ